MVEVKSYKRKARSKKEMSVNNKFAALARWNTIATGSLDEMNRLQDRLKKQGRNSVVMRHKSEYKLVEVK